MPRESRTAAPASRSARRSPRRDIEGLRAVAILAVVLYHAHVGVLSGGYVGVDVFFVISGFLITDLLWRAVRGTASSIDQRVRPQLAHG
jgi:peptidoglycan/LPS O-acetylase OafA/YrhL